jgi:DNA-binding winged helix-turn-helix (wHTH) protein
MTIMRGFVSRIRVHHMILVALFATCTIFYYLGQAIILFDWQVPRWEFLYTVHDVHRLLFLIPIMWASYYLGMKRAIIVALASFAVFLPRALLISAFPDALQRAMFDGVIELAVGSLVAIPLTVKKQNGVRLATPEAFQDDVFTSGGLEVDLAKQRVRRYGHEVRLTKTEYGLLSCLVCNCGKVVTHEELLHSVWGPVYDQEKEYLYTFIAQLRRKLKDDPLNPQFIHTEPGFGYRFVESDSLFNSQGQASKPN